MHVLLGRFIDALREVSPDRVVMEEHPRSGPFVLALVFGAYGYYMAKSVPVSFVCPLRKYHGWRALVTEIPTQYHSRKRFELQLALHCYGEVKSHEAKGPPSPDTATACALLIAHGECAKEQANT
jgi:hypothetical protein